MGILGKSDFFISGKYKRLLETSDIDCDGELSIGQWILFLAVGELGMLDHLS
jgi:hypothetical protein